MENKNTINENSIEARIEKSFRILERGRALLMEYDGQYLDLLEITAKAKYYQHVINITIESGNMEIQLINFKTHEDRKREISGKAIEKARRKRYERVVSETTVGTYKWTPRSYMPITWR